MKKNVNKASLRQKKQGKNRDFFWQISAALLPGQFDFVSHLNTFCMILLRSVCFTLACLLQISAFAQKNNVNLNVHYGSFSFNPILQDSKEGVGLEFGYLRKCTRHLCAGFGLNWTYNEPEIYLYATDPGLEILTIKTEYNLLMLQPEARWYFKSAYKGLFAGVTANASVYLVNASGDESNFYPQDHGFSGMGMGFVGGYQFLFKNGFGLLLHLKQDFTWFNAETENQGVSSKFSIAAGISQAF